MAKISGTAGSDNLLGTAFNDVINCLAGNDTANGSGGNDVISGGNGADSLNGGAGNDNLKGDAGNDNLIGGTGNDILDGGLGTDNMQGGTGNDTYVVNTATDAVNEGVNTSTHDKVSASFSVNLVNFTQIEDVALTGTAAINATGDGKDNILTGNAGNNFLNGGAGNDQLIGGSGTDFLQGGLGVDSLNGGAGGDNLFGGDGKDIYFVDNPGDFIGDIGGANDLVFSSNLDINLATAAFGLVAVESGTLLGTLDLNLFGSISNNTLTGNSGANLIEGFGGSDLIRGAGGRDIINLDAGAATDTYFYKVGDLDGSVDVYTGQWDAGATLGIDMGDELLVLSELINVTNLGEIANFISSTSDNQSGKIYFIDLDGTGTNLQPVPFIHMTDDAGVVGFFADGFYNEL